MIRYFATMLITPALFLSAIVGLTLKSPAGNAVCFASFVLIGMWRTVRSRKGRRMIRVIINHLPQWPF